MLNASALYLYPACGLVLMLLTWPMTGSGRRVLRRWGNITNPTADQIRLVVRHLRERRLLVVPLMFLAPLTARAMPTILGPTSDLGSYHLLGSLLVAWLLAEVIATVRPRREPVRVASLVRRDWLVPRWAVGLHLALAAAAITLAVVAQPWPGGWYLIALTLVTSLVVYGIAWLAMTRPAGINDDVDAALRTRTARSAVGAGILLAGLLIDAAGTRFHIEPAAARVWTAGVSVITVATLIGWGAVISGPRRA
ncbi:MAG TPA: hypothetical protein VF892_20650 [Pseudonocardiaceae bacterium]|nr:hypothetical protein [Pseudonocardiaceae bacterium]